MKIIQDLADRINEEITDAWKYAKDAMTHKEDDPELSKTFALLANEELGHADKLHAQVVRIIKAYKEKSGDPPAHMQVIYDITHKQMIDRVADVKALLA